MSKPTVATLPGSFGIDPQPMHGSFYGKTHRSAYVTDKMTRESERPQLEAWLRANGWTGRHMDWTHKVHGPKNFKQAIWTQLIASWHDKIAIEALAKPVMPRPPLVWRKWCKAGFSVSERRIAETWLRKVGAVLLEGSVLDTHRTLAALSGEPPPYPGWRVPGDPTDFNLELAYEAMFDRWLTLEAERRGWDWEGMNGHPSSFQLPTQRTIKYRTAIKELWGKYR